MAHEIKFYRVKEPYRRLSNFSPHPIVILEQTANDLYWVDGGDGSGNHTLGKILMDIRADLTKDGVFDE